MSIEATIAVYALAPHWPRMIAEAELGRNMRPSPLAVHSVALALAERYRNARGYVDETVDQLVAMVPVDVATVARSLAVLHVLNVWTIERRGSRRAGSQRCLGIELIATARRVGLDQLVATARPVQLELVATARPVEGEPAFDSSRPGPELIATRTGTHRDSATLPITPVSIPVDDDTRVMSGNAETDALSSSSFSIALLIDKSARWYARQQGHRGNRPYIAQTARNIRLERLDEIRGYQSEGLDLAQALARMLGSDSAGRLAMSEPA